MLTLVRRDSGFEYSDDTTPENIFIYEVLKNIIIVCFHHGLTTPRIQGGENPFVLSRVYDVDWMCQYDMRWYTKDFETFGEIKLCSEGTRLTLNLVKW